MSWKCKHCGEVNQKQSSISEQIKMIDVLYKVLEKAGKPVPVEVLKLWVDVKNKLKEAKNEISLVL